MGNPHFMVDPIIAKAVAQHIANAFAAVDSSHAGEYQATRKNLKEQLTPSFRNGVQDCCPIAARASLLITIRGLISATASVSTSTSFSSRSPEFRPHHRTCGSDRIDEGAEDQGDYRRAVSQSENRGKVAESTGAKVVDFAQFPGALPDTDTYVKMIDVLVNNLAGALK